MKFFIDEWIDKLISKIKNEFGDRLSFIGLQGSYKRKEADDSSDKIGANHRICSVTTYLFNIMGNGWEKATPTLDEFNKNNG